MKKTRFLVLALVVAVMLMGAGYAWWNDTITVQSTVTTGNLNVDIVAQSVAPDDYVGMEVVPDFDRASEQGDCALIKFTNIYPGKGGTATLTFKNKSTMAVKMDRIIECTLDKVDEDAGYHGATINIAYASSLGAVNFFYDTATGKFTYPADAADVVLAPNATATFTFSAKLPEGTKYDNSNQSKDDLGFIIKPNFIQWNQ